MNNDMIEFLACPENGEALVEAEDGLARSNGTKYPVRFGVPILVPGVQVEQNDYAISDAFLDDMIAIAENPARAENRDELADAFRCHVNFADVWLNSEASMFVNRLNGQSDQVRPPYKRDESVPVEPEKPHRSGKVEMTPLVAPKAAHAGWQLTLNMSIRNDTDLTLPVTGRDAANLHASIRTEPDSRLAKFLPFGRSRSLRGQRTDLLVDLAPGRSITQPIKLTMPETPGTVDYVVTLERKGRVLARTQQSITLVTGQDPLETGWGDSGEIRDYNTDHLHAFEVMTQWLDAYAKGEESVLLKLGGSFSPMTHVWPGRRFNMDIDAHGMFSHSLLRAPDVMNPDRFMDIIGDGMRPPFRDGVLDAVAMYATFHHFPDPVRLLRGFRPKLAPNGIVMLFCEPVGHVFADSGATEYVEELERGAFEQSFMYWEYAALADAAGYDVIDTANDMGSAKIALRPKA